MATPIREIIKESSIYDMKVLDNLDSVTDPTVNDDSTLGYSRKSTWYNQSTGEIYRCIDASAGAAVWGLTTLTVDDLGTAALADSVDFATAAQGSLADSSIQPGDNISLLVNDSGFVDSTAISSAISLHEADANPHPQYFVTWAEYNNGSNPTTAPEANFTDALALGNGAIAGATYAFAFLGNVTGTDGISMGRLSSADMRGVAIGYNADAGQESFAGGYDAQVTGDVSVGVGDVTVSANGAVGIGDSVTISGQEGTGIGRYVQVTSLYGAAYGNAARSTHNYSSSFGLLSYTQWSNQIRLGSGYRPQTNSWDSQAGLSENTRRVDTTDATPYSFELATRGSGSQQSAYVEADVICHETSTGEMWHQKVTALLKGGVAAPWSVIGSVAKSTAITSGGLTVSADLDFTTASQIKLQVTGEAAKNLTWTIQARIIAKVA